MMGLKMNLKVKTVTEVNNYVARLLESDSILANTKVKGVISELGPRKDGHIFFNLLDPGDQNNMLRCVLFEAYRQNVTIELANDIAVVISGKLSIYRKKSYYQLQVRTMVYDDEAIYHNEFLRLKNKYEKLGYFDPRRKIKTLPKLKKIGLVASKVSAAYGDFMKILNSKFPLLEVVLVDVHVSGLLTKIEIPRAIKRLNELNDIDLIVVTRGGGSEEELFVFNDEAICEAVYASKIPVLSAVGHERDLTHIDNVAHISVGTPSMAAELIASRHGEDVREIKNLMLNLHAIMSTLIGSEKRAIEFELRSRFEQVEEGLRQAKMDLIKTHKELLSLMDGLLNPYHKDVSHSYEMLRSLDVEETLKRGYALVLKDGEGVNVESLKPGDKLDIRLSRAELGVSVDQVELKGVNDGKETS